MTYRGDIRLGDTIDVKFTTTAAATGAPTTLAGTPVISAYVGNSTTQLTAGITLTVDFDSVTGLHNVRVVASSDNGYATATNYQLVITTGTVGGTSAVGYVVAEFSIENRSALMPTTATRTLDVSSTGEAGVDFDNILLSNGQAKIGISASGTLSGTHSTTTADLGTNAPSTDISGCILYIPTRGVNHPIDSYNTGTGVATFSPALASNTLTNGDVYVVYVGSKASTGAPPAVNTTQFAGQTVTAAAGVTLPSSVASPTNITAATGIVLSGVTHTGAVIPTVTTTTTATNLTNAPTAGDLTATMKTSIGTAVAASAVASVTGNVGGNVTGSVGTLTTTAIDSILTRAMAESYAADGATMTVAQALYLIAQTIGEFSVSGTTVTVKKLDGSTSAAVYSLDSAVSPTSRTRTS